MDEFTREALATAAARSFTADDTTVLLDKIVAETDRRPVNLRMDNGPELTAGNLTTVTPPAPMSQTRFTYDSLSRVTSVTDGNGQRIDYAYDRLDRIVAISEHNGPVLQTMDYDGTGAMTDRAHGGVITEFTLDTYPTAHRSPQRPAPRPDRPRQCPTPTTTPVTSRP
ncbi:hypothetical protein JT362_16150 [Actinophytocola sp. S1-96]|uniref:YD repeat-containing protein n=1 Tax=Actinophytocola gossypii TaxID=2812003 RepID=A0ABT2J9V4_9PSEU|nr:hypothetical protein [Actinophytocola gossypii]